MRVAVITGIFPPDVGGPATYVPLIAAALAKRGHRIRVLATSEPHDLTHRDVYPFRVIRVNRRTPLAVRTLRLVAAAAREGRGADVLYANGMYLEAALAARLCRKPLVVKVVGDEAWERSRMRGWTGLDFDAFQVRADGVRGWTTKQLLTSSIKRADRVIVPSRYLKRVVTGWGVDESRCRVIYNAAPGTTRTTPKSSAAPWLRVVTASRLVPWKRVDLVVRAIRQVGGVSLRIIGDGPCRRALESLAAREEAAGIVEFAGWLPRSSLPSLLGEHDVFVLASSYEGLPHVLLEATQQGLAVVATRSGGTEEVVEDGRTGLLVAPSADEFAAALTRLRDEPSLRARLVAGGRAMLRQRFSKDAMCRETEGELLAAARWDPAADVVPEPAHLS